MTRPSDPEKLLERLVADARSETAPKVDWNAVERSLMARVNDDAPNLADRPPLHSMAWLWAIPAGALAVTGAIIWMTRSEVLSGPAPMARSVAPAATSRTLNAAELAVPAAVEAVGTSVTVRHESRATWTLSPHSLAHLTRTGEVIELSLDRGTLDARVVPSPLPESFVVMADHTRVAVHGTAFRVTRTGERVIVEVSEGVVAVGPVGGPGVKLGVASHGEFSLSGTRIDAEAAATNTAPAVATPAAEETGAVAVKTHEPHGSARPVPAEAPPKSPAVGAASESVSANRAVSAVRSCFGSQTTSESDLKITVTSRLSLRVQPDGTIVEALFDPPLAPAVQACVDGAFGKIRFPASERGLSVERSINLER